MKIGDVIKDLRQKAGFTQKQLAEAANVAQSAISYAESNMREPTIDVLRKLCHVLNISITSFFELVEDKVLQSSISPSEISLNDCEIDLIKKFRSLTKDEQFAVQTTIDAFARGRHKTNAESSTSTIGDEITVNSQLG